MGAFRASRSRVAPAARRRKQTTISPQRLVGHADHRHLGDVGVLQEHVLDLGGEQVLAAADDHLLHPAGDLDVAARVHASRGRRCAASRRRRSPRRWPPGCRCSRASRRSRGRRSRPARRPARPRWSADRGSTARPAASAGRRSRRSSSASSCAGLGEHGRALGLAVDGLDRRAEQRAARRISSGGTIEPPGHDPPTADRSRGCVVGPRDSADQHRRHAEHDLHAARLHDLEDQRRVEQLGQDHPAAAPRRAEHEHAAAGRVEQRHVVDHGVAGAQARAVMP